MRLTSIHIHLRLQSPWVLCDEAQPADDPFVEAPLVLTACLGTSGSNNDRPYARQLLQTAEGSILRLADHNLHRCSSRNNGMRTLGAHLGSLWKRDSPRKLFFFSFSHQCSSFIDFSDLHCFPCHSQMTAAIADMGIMFFDAWQIKRGRNLGVEVRRA